MTTQKEIDEAANNYNKTKDQKYKNLWYKLVKEFADGSYNTERWNVSVSAINKADDGTYIIIGRSRLHGPVRDTKTKTIRLR